MKIDDSHKPGAASPRVTPRSDPTGEKPRTRRRPPKVQTTDQVHLSPRAQAYQKARQTLSALPDIEAEKVREIQDRLQSGRYRIDSDQIAEKMIKDALANDR